MVAFNILDRGFDVAGGLFLEASAGTGKTFAIEHLFVRLLLEGESPLTIDQILVVTFTRAATRELKMRIRSNLEKAQGALNAQSAEWDYLRAIIDGGEEKVYSAALRLEEALVRFDEAAIYTIHGFCYKVLTEGAFEAHVGFEIGEPESRSHLPLMQETLFDFFRTHLRTPSFSPYQVGALLRREKGDPKRLALSVRSLIEKDKEIPKRKSFFEQQASFNEKIGRLSSEFKVASKPLLDDFQRLAVCYKKMTSSAFLVQMKMLSTLLEKGKAREREFDLLLKDKEFFLEKMIPENQKVRATLPDAHDLNYLELFGALRSEILPLICEAKDPKLLLLRLAHEGKKKWESFYNIHEHLPPDDLLKKTEEALQDSRFLALIKERFRGVIIDEFQDTDPVQWRIVKQLYTANGPHLYLVGDPKQSIYGFRKADVYTYLKASSLFSEERRFFLSTNYRSDPSLIHALNRLFGYSKEWMPLPASEESLTYQDVTPSPDNTDWTLEDGKGAIHFILTQDSLGREKSWPTKRVERELFFPFLSREIVHLKEKGGLSYEQMVVLVKDRFQAERVHATLKSLSIPSVLKKKGSAADSTALHPLMEVLEGCLRVDDPSCLKRALGAPLLGWSAHDLQDKEKVMRVKPLFLSLFETWKRQGVGALFHQLLQYKREDTTVEKAILERKDLSFYAALHDLICVLIEKERKEALLPHQLFEFLKRLRNSEEEVTLPSSLALQGVQIMTGHMSKGLEFDVVFALGLASRHTRLEEFVAEGEQLIPSSGNEGAIFEADAEKLRQLYVALTRAKKRVYIPLPLDLDEKEIQKGTASPLELFCAQLLTDQGESNLEALYEKHLPLTHASIVTLLTELKELCSLTFEELQEKTSLAFSIPTSPTPKLTPPTPYTFSFSPQPLLSFTTLAHKHKRDEQLPEQRSEHTVHGLPLGAETGIVLHHIFEQIFALEYYFPFDPHKITALIQSEVDGTPLQGWEDVILELIDEIMHLDLGQGFTLVDLKPGEVLQEVEFLYPEKEGLIKGFIDLAFVKEGVYYLLDWKSNFLGVDDSAYSEQSMHNAMQENDYTLQASIYSEALRRYLKHFDSRPFKTCFGGALYIFLRGRKAYHLVNTD